MRKVVFLFGLIAFLVASSAWAADVNGKWIARIESPRGVSERVFTFQVAGDKVTGTIANRQVAEGAIWQEKGKPETTITLKTQNVAAQEISEGKISGNEISFVLNVEMQGKPGQNIYTGKVSDGEIAFTMETKVPEGFVPGPGGAPKPQQIIAKKAGASD
jgi:hypothetical protein